MRSSLDTDSSTRLANDANQAVIANIRDMQDGQDRAVATLMSAGTDDAIEILARVQEAYWIDELEREIDETLTTLEAART